MAFPDRVFVIVVETNGPRDPERMALLSQKTVGGRLAPTFTSMQLATAFLARAQELGYVVKLDYIFPVDGAILAEDFPGHEFRLNPSPENFFTESDSPSEP